MSNGALSKRAYNSPPPRGPRTADKRHNLRLFSLDSDAMARKFKLKTRAGDLSRKPAAIPKGAKTMRRLV